MYKQKIEEIEIYNQRESKQEFNELRNLKEKIANSTEMNRAGTKFKYSKSKFFCFK